MGPGWEDGPMSQTTSAASKRSVPGMIGAMAVTLLAVFGWGAFRAVTSENEATTIAAVPWEGSARMARADGLLTTYVPPGLPQGWRATSATYRPGEEAQWHLGMLTGQGKYVGLEESRRSAPDLIEQYVDEEATKGPAVTISGESWVSYRDSGGDYALIRTVEAPDGRDTRLLVVGNAGQDEIKRFAATLTDGPVPGEEGAGG